jgi:hypothetical protein
MNSNLNNEFSTFKSENYLLVEFSYKHVMDLVNFYSLTDNTVHFDKEIVSNAQEGITYIENGMLDSLKELA